MIHLGIIEDEGLMLQSIRETFSGNPDIEITLEAQTLEDALEDLTPEVQLTTLLLDINLPGMSGLRGIRYLKERRPDMDIIMLTNKDSSDDIFKALCAGAVSYISKKKASPPILREAVTMVSRGESYMSPGIARKVIEHFAPPDRSTANPVLTPRQHQIVELLTDGLSYKMIADKLIISVETVRDHIKKIYRTLQVNSKAEVIRKKLDGEI
ncbi:response regulator [Lewinella sp. LCG006]|uniref:response regulator n=1 Tax=Lewinella sp. LCG006 TaxID=3231911 RepID=UPI003460C102